MSDLHDLEQRVAELERRLAALDGGGARPAADSELRELIRSGNKIGAIKRYRERTGVGLAEAKDAIDRMDSGL